MSCLTMPLKESKSQIQIWCTPIQKNEVGFNNWEADVVDCLVHKADWPMNGVTNQCTCNVGNVDHMKCSVTCGV